MTKLLLPALLLLSAATCHADELFPLTEFFNVTCDGQPLTDGYTLEVTDVTDTSDLYGPGTVTYSADIKIENLDIMPGYIYGALYFSDQPTAAMYQSDPVFWGDPQLCYWLTKNGRLTGSCLNANLPFNAGSGCFEVPVDGVGEFSWSIHISGARADAEETYTLVMQAKTDDSADAQNLSSQFRLNLHFINPEAGVAGLGADPGEQPAIFFDLQGRKVESPDKGFYIMRKGPEVKKVFRR